MKKVFGILAVSAFLFASCGNANTTETESATDSTVATEVEVTEQETVEVDTLVADSTVAEEVVAETEATPAA